MPKSSIIGALAVRLGMDASDFEAGAAKAKGKASGLKGELAGLAGGLKSIVGPGAAAAAAAGAVAIGFAKAAETAQFADDLAASASRIGITAEALQELRHAAEANDVPLDALDKGLEALNGTLGALQSGIGAGRIKKAFAELGIPPEVIASLNNAGELLPLIADRINEVGSHAEQVQIAKKLGIEELLPLLREGSEGIASLRAEARDLGLVLGNEVVERQAEMNEQLRIAEERSKAAGRSFGASFTPALVAMKNALADAVDWLGTFIDKFNRIEDRANSTIRKQISERQRDIVNLTPDWLKGSKVAEGLIKKKSDEIRELQSQLRLNDLAAEVRAFGEGPRGGGGGGAGGAGKSKAPKLGEVELQTIDRDTIVDLTKRSRDDLIEAWKPVFDGASYQGAMDGLKRSRADVRESYRWAIASGLEAAIYGGGKGLMQYLADSFRQRLIDRLADGLSSVFENIAFGGGDGGLLSKGFSIFSKAFGFATGGSFKVGGFGGPDSQFVPLRLTPGELVDVRRPGDDRGIGGLVVRVEPSPYFDARVEEVASPIAARAGAQAAAVGAAMAERSLLRRSKQRLGG